MADKATLVGVLAFYGMAVAVGVGALWPPLEDTFVSISESFPAGFDTLLGGLSIATPAGWMHAELMSILGPGFLIAVAMISAASATAGEEQDRTLGLVLSAGVPRGTFLSAKATATLTHVLIVAVALFVGMLIANPIGNLGIPVANLLAATLNMVLIALVFGAMTLGLGAVTGDKRLTLAITGAVIAVSFIAANFLGLNESLVWLSKLNFWYPYVASTPLANGLDWGLAATMVALALGMGAMAFVAFSRRADLRG
ncbi:ABC transporter permease subunit [Flaviflexus huanghaiensis]|uniref:ABC transporter permease subunit n=1 Tax=Flaviflexus huanghaiensis TaxID=1111473 RepID=UPI0015F97C44